MAVEEKYRIHGLIIQPSQTAQDILAAFHLGAQTVLSTLAPQTVAGLVRPSDEHVVDYVGQDEENYGEVTLPDLMGMDPLRREALLSAYGLTVVSPPGKEPDPTASILNQMLEADGIPVKPGPGGAVAGYEPTDEGEAD